MTATVIIQVNNVKFGTKTAEMFTMKVEIVYLLAGLLWLILLVDLTFSMISLILKSDHNGIQRISKILPILIDFKSIVHESWL